VCVCVCLCVSLVRITTLKEVKHSIEDHGRPYVTLVVEADLSTPWCILVAFDSDEESVT